MMINNYKYKYFEESYRRDCRKRLVNNIHNYLVKTKYPPRIIAFLIKSFHFSFPYLLTIIFLFAPLQLVYSIFTIMWLFIILYIYLKGCFISHLEYKLYKKKFINIVDPYLILLNYDITNENRYKGTLIIALLFMCFVLSILFYRIK